MLNCQFRYNHGFLMNRCILFMVEIERRQKKKDIEDERKIKIKSIANRTGRGFLFNCV